MTVDFNDYFWVSSSYVVFVILSDVSTRIVGGNVKVQSCLCLTSL